MKWWSIAVIFLSLILGSIAPSHAQQQLKRMPRVGYLRLVELPVYDDAFRTGLRELGYVEGQNLALERRYAGGSVERLGPLAAELVKLNVDITVAGSTQAIDAAKRATKTIPIVFPVTFDPVASGFVASLARPGGNLTGLTTVNPDVAAKRLELIKEVILHTSRVAVLRSPTNSASVVALKETQSGAKRFGMSSFATLLS
jgi:putative ABC transport system substrate-binding protein